MRILVTFRDAHEVRRAGFNANAKHSKDPDLTAWWPGRDLESLRGATFALAVVSGETLEHCRSNGMDPNRLLTMIRSRLQTAPAILLIN